MATPDLFAHSRSSLNPFLYANVGIEDGAGAQTIASLFGRTGCDPWEEAARLSHLPVRAAVASLAAMIAGAPSCPRTLPEATRLAETLVALLPGPASAGLRAQARPMPKRLPPLLSGRSFLSGLPFLAGRKIDWVLVLGLLLALAVAWSVVADAFGPRGADDGLRSFDAIPTVQSR